jgi:hypothetical protein
MGRVHLQQRGSQAPQDKPHPSQAEEAVSIKHSISLIITVSICNLYGPAADWVPRNFSDAYHLFPMQTELETRFSFATMGQHVGRIRFAHQQPWGGMKNLFGSSHCVKPHPSKKVFCRCYGVGEP